MPESVAKAPPLLIDAMLGTLARRLRWLGYDAEYRSDLPDDEMMRIAKEQSRLLTTRDRELAGRRGVRGLFIASLVLGEQIQTVEDALGPSFGLARCMVCNGRLLALSIEEATLLVPHPMWPVPKPNLGVVTAVIAFTGPEPIGPILMKWKGSW